MSKRRKLSMDDSFRPGQFDAQDNTVNVNLDKGNIDGLPLSAVISQLFSQKIEEKDKEQKRYVRNSYTAQIKTKGKKSSSTVTVPLFLEIAETGSELVRTSEIAQAMSGLRVTRLYVRMDVEYKPTAVTPRLKKPDKPRSSIESSRTYESLDITDDDLDDQSEKKKRLKKTFSLVDVKIWKKDGLRDQQASSLKRRRKQFSKKAARFRTTGRMHVMEKIHASVPGLLLLKEVAEEDKVVYVFEQNKPIIKEPPKKSETPPVADVKEPATTHDKHPPLHRNSNRLANLSVDEDPVEVRLGPLSHWKDVTIGELSNDVRCIAKSLLACKIASGSRVSLFCKNSQEWITFYLGTMAIGAVPVAIPVENSYEAALQLLVFSDTKYLLIEDKDSLIQLVKSLHNKGKVFKKFFENLKIVVFVKRNRSQRADQTGGGKKLDALFKDFFKNKHLQFFHWRSFMYFGSAVKRIDFEKRALSVRGDHLALILFTPGTEGNYRGVMLTHSNLLWAVRALEENLELQPWDSTVAGISFSHILGQLTCILLPLTAKLKVYLPRAIGDTSTANFLRAVRPTILFQRPAFYIQIYNSIHEMVGSAKDISQEAWKMCLGMPYIRKLYVGYGGSLPVEVLAFFKKTIGTAVEEIYGSTETAGIISINNKVISPEIAVSIIPLRRKRSNSTEEENETEGDGQGEILVNGPNVFVGYFKDYAETTKCFITSNKTQVYRTNDYGEFNSKTRSLKFLSRIPDTVFCAAKRGKDEKREPKLVIKTYLENHLRLLPLIDNVAVFFALHLNDDDITPTTNEQARHTIVGRKSTKVLFFSVLVTLSPSRIKQIVQENNLESPKLVYKGSIIRKITKDIQEHIVKLNKNRNIFPSGSPGLKKFTILKKPFVVEKRELTFDGRVRRGTIENHFKSDLSKMLGKNEYFFSGNYHGAVVLSTPLTEKEEDVEETPAASGKLKGAKRRKSMGTWSHTRGVAKNTEES